MVVTTSALGGGGFGDTTDRNLPLEMYGVVLKCRAIVNLRLAFGGMEEPVEETTTMTPMNLLSVEEAGPKRFVLPCDEAVPENRLQLRGSWKQVQG